MATDLFNDLGSVFVSVVYDPAHCWVTCTWLGEQNATTIMLGADAALTMLEQHACCCLLNDNRQISGTWSNDIVEGLLSDWAPRALRGGLTHMATVTYPDTIAAIYEEVMQLNLAGRLHMRLYYDLLSAQQWLQASQACQ